jgi:alcohol dehydrogenase
VQAGDRVAVVGCGGVGISALMAAVAVGAEPVVAVDAAPQKLEAARSFGATEVVEWQGSPEATAEAVREVSGGGVDYAIEATGRPEAMEAAFLATRKRGAAVLIGIPRAGAVVTLPAMTIPRMERRVLGSIYGSSKPERDFPDTLDLYRDGRLPLDRLVSHRLPLEEAARGFELMQSGDALRVVLEMPEVSG